MDIFDTFFNKWDIKRVYKWGTIVLMALALFLVLEAVSVVKGLGYEDPATNVISVSGTGESTSIPNIATFSFSISEDAKTVADAQKSVTTKTNAILAGLKNIGIEDKDIKSADYNVYPKYTYETAICGNGYCPPGKQINDGYTVSQTITVKVRKTEDAGKALAVAGDKGATNISSLTLTLDDPSAPENEARLKAIDDAKSKAEALAKRLGVKLVRVTSYYDNSPQYPMYYAGNAKSAVTDMRAEAAPSITVGENKTTASVTITYEIR